MKEPLGGKVFYKYMQVFVVSSSSLIQTVQNHVDNFHCQAMHLCRNHSAL